MFKELKELKVNYNTLITKQYIPLIPIKLPETQEYFADVRDGTLHIYGIIEGIDDYEIVRGARAQKMGLEPLNAVSIGLMGKIAFGDLESIVLHSETYESAGHTQQKPKAKRTPKPATSSGESAGESGRYAARTGESRTGGESRPSIPSGGESRSGESRPSIPSGGESRTGGESWPSTPSGGESRGGESRGYGGESRSGESR